MFCDRALPDFGVVQRVAPAGAKVDREEVHIGNFSGSNDKSSPNGRFMAGRQSDNDNGSYSEHSVVVDVESGRILSETAVAGFTADSRFMIESEGDYRPITLRNIASSKRVWTIYRRRTSGS